MTDIHTETDTGAAEEAARYSGNPMAGMDPEFAAHPQPLFKMLRDETPVLSVPMPSGPGVPPLTRPW